MRKKNGFTIIEMLSTVAIVTVLSALVIFSITSYINSSKEKAYKITVDNIKHSAELYVDEISNDIKWISNGIAEYTCIYIQELKNIGIIDENFKIYGKDIELTNKTLIKVTRDNNSFAIVNVDIDNKDCREND